MPPQTNQFKPLPPLEDVAPIIIQYWKQRKPDTEVVKLLRQNHIDTSLYGVGLTSYKKMRRRLGLLSTRQQNHSIESIHPYMEAIRKRFPNAGAREIGGILFHEYGMRVPRDIIVVYFRVYEPDLIRKRKEGRLQRRRFWAAGVNDILAVDQHDKWKRFGLALHTGIDPFSTVIHWIKIWWTNSNPKLIASYYLDTVEKTHRAPLVTQSDPGSENYGIANAHTALRHVLDPRLDGYIQHRWMRSKKNVKPEILWSQLRKRFTPGFEDLLEEGVTNGWYDTNRPLDVLQDSRLVFRWLFIPYLQSELDRWVDRVNNSKKRADRNKVLPHGAPLDIQSFPERFGCLDFSIEVRQEAIDAVWNTFAPPNDPVFELVPPQFQKYAQALYESMDSPFVSSDNIWAIYRELVNRFEHLEDAIEFGELCQEYLQKVEQDAQEQDAVPPAGIELLGGPDGVDKDGYIYLGGVNNGQGLDTNHHDLLDRLDEQDEDFEIDKVVFSDLEKEDDDDDY